MLSVCLVEEVLHQVDPKRKRVFVEDLVVLADVDQEVHDENDFLFS